MIKVLIIDDDVDMTDVLKLVLANTNFEVEAISSSTEAVAKTHQFNPDVIVLDLLMPGMDGWEVCRAIRAFSKVPILILSVFNTPSILQQALDAGADDYLTKPVTSGVLIAHINGLVRRARGELKTGQLVSQGTA
ncbi:MAG: response regulator transcription factor [Chloroflexota bacterium]